MEVVDWGDLLVGTAFVVLGLLMILCPKDAWDRTVGVGFVGIGLIYLKVSEIV